MAFTKLTILSSKLVCHPLQQSADMKVLYLLLVSLDAVQLVNGLAFAGAEVTSPAKRDEVMLHGRSPKPTPAPPLRGMMRDNELFGRQEDINTLSTCAFIDGKADNAITCLNSTCDMQRIPVKRLLILVLDSRLRLRLLDNHCRRVHRQSILGLLSHDRHLNRL